MHTRTRDMIRYGELCGFTLMGLDGRDHYQMTHPNGSTVRVSGGPGDYRGDENCKALMRRLSGVTPDIGKRAGKFKKGSRRPRFHLGHAVREQRDYERQRDLRRAAERARAAGQLRRDIAALESRINRARDAKRRGLIKSDAKIRDMVHEWSALDDALDRLSADIGPGDDQ